MKTPLRLLWLAFPLATSALLTSCITERFESTSTYPSEVGYTTYTTLPDDYSGDAYYYNNQYYAGGRYEPGTYTYRGRTYNNRYYYDGDYIYGGEYRQRSASGRNQQPVVRASNRSGYVTYQTLPADYSGDAYYYNNQYYAGGRYERGTYAYRGRTYNQRYYHNGQYIYGGEYRQPTTTTSNRALQRSTSTQRTTRQLSY